MKLITKEELENATIEAIFWWKNIERFYHYQFKEINSILNKKRMEYQEFFILKYFNPFLKEYSVRRNIKNGDQNVFEFLKTLRREGFFVELNHENKEIDKKVIDQLSEYLCNKTELTNRKNCKSLLSKIAFIIRPDQFFIYDSLAKSSIKKFRKNLNTRNNQNIRSKDLENYQTFYELSKLLTKDVDLELNLVIEEFQEEILHSCKELISKDNKAIKMRIIDKHLWIKSQEKGEDDFNTNNHLIYRNYNKNFPLYLRNGQ